MKTLQELCQASDKLFEQGFQISPMQAEAMDRFNVYKENNLLAQAEKIHHSIRIEQATTLGFHKVIPQEMFQMLMAPNQITWENTSYESIEWFYDHVKQEVKLGKGINLPRIHFKHPKHWFTSGEFRIGSLNDLKGLIPYGVVLKIAELKKLNLFNFFSVAAPIEMFEEQPKIPWDMLDPVVTANIVEIKQNRFDDVGEVTYFFIARW